MPPIAPARLNRWFRRHSLTLVATLGGAAGVAFAVARLGGGPAPASHAGPPPTALVEPAPTPPRDTVVDTVQVALLLDTSSSMDGLINQARSHLWKMVDQLGAMTRVVDGKVRGVKIELAIYEYGNDTLPAEGGFIRQVLPFTSDLDQASEKLGALFTNGGSEFAGQAIQTAVTSLAWSKDPAALRFVFVAGNESFDQGSVAATTAIGDAAARDITVQLIYCGSDDDSDTRSWGTAAKLAQSDLTTIDQDRVAAHIPAPQDAEILRLGGELNGTYMAYGAGGQAAVARQAAADASSARLGAKVALERNALKAKKAYRNDSWDLVDAVEGDAGFLGRAKDEELPAAMRGKSLADKQAAVAAQASRRAALKAEIAKLEAERDAFLKAEAAKHGTADAPSLETELIKGTRKAATKKGYHL